MLNTDGYVSPVAKYLFEYKNSYLIKCIHIIANFSASKIGFLFILLHGKVICKRKKVKSVQYWLGKIRGIL